MLTFEKFDNWLYDRDMPQTILLCQGATPDELRRSLGFVATEKNGDPTGEVLYGIKPRSFLVWPPSDDLTGGACSAASVGCLLANWPSKLLSALAGITKLATAS
jgi:hypothetical protein